MLNQKMVILSHFLHFFINGNLKGAKMANLLYYLTEESGNEVAIEFLRMVSALKLPASITTNLFRRVLDLSLRLTGLPFARLLYH
jgi:hypothetical protein